MIYFWKQDGKLVNSSEENEIVEKKEDLLRLDESQRWAILENEGGSASETETNALVAEISNYSTIHCRCCNVGDTKKP